MKLLVVVDMQVDFVTGTLGSSYAQAIVPNVVKKVKEHLDSGQPVLFTIDTHDKLWYCSSREYKNLQDSGHCQHGTEGIKLIPELNELITQYPDKLYCNDGISFLTKYDSWGLNIQDHTDIYHALYHRAEGNIDTVEIIGVATNVCVLSVAICLHNFMCDANFVIDASCCASYNPELHEKALDVLEGIYFKIENR